MNGVNRIAREHAEDKKHAPAGGSPVHKRPRKQEKLIRLDDLIPKGNVSGGRQLLFGATDINQTKPKKEIENMALRKKK